MLSRRRSDLAMHLVLPLLLGAAGCAPFPPVFEPALSGVNAGLRREELAEGKRRCAKRECRSTLRAAHGPIVVTERAREYGRHEIPGWDGSVAGRVAGWVFRAILRENGLTTDRTYVGAGTRIAVDSGGGGWQLSCRLFWITDEEIERDEDDNDQVVRTARRTEGLDCRAYARGDSATVRWRFRRGIAPPRDSIAVVYDSLAAAKSPDVSPAPPIVMERLHEDGRPPTRYEAVALPPSAWMSPARAVHGLLVTRPTGETVAELHGRRALVLDVATDASDEEVHVLRLLAGILATPLVSTR